MLKVGGKTRPYDIEKIAKHKGINIYEFHLSDEDLFVDIKHSYDKPVVFHAPEYIRDESDYRTLINPATSSDRLYKLSKKLIDDTIEYVNRNKDKFIGTPMIIMHPGGMSEEERIIDTEILLDNLYEFIQTLDYGTNEFLLENMPPEPWYYGGSWISNIFVDDEEIANFCEKNNINICLDISHAGLACNYLGKNIEEYIDNLLPYTRHIHIADSIGTNGEGVQIDEGEIHWPKVFKQIREIEDDIYIVPEIWMGHHDNHKGMYTALDRIENYLEE